MDADQVNIFLVDDDQDCSYLTEQFLERSGISHPIHRFSSFHRMMYFLNSELNKDMVGCYIVVIGLDIGRFKVFDLLSAIKSTQLHASQKLATVMYGIDDNTKIRLLCQQKKADAYCVKDFSDNFNLDKIVKQLVSKYLIHDNNASSVSSETVIV